MAETQGSTNTKQKVTRSFPYVALWILAAAYSAFLVGCSLPRIVILDDPLSPEEHINLGVAYEKRGELESAIKEYEAAAKKLPVAYLYLGNVFFQKNDFENAERYYRTSIEKDPGNADAYNNLAWLYYTKKEKLDEAERLVLKAMELNPANKNDYQDTLMKIRALRTVQPLPP